MKRFYPAALLLAGTLAGCDRGPDIIDNYSSYDLTGTYVAGNTLVAAHPVAMYTKAGLVSDQAAVTRFVNRRRMGDYFSATDQPAPSNYSLRVVFRANNRATILYTSPTRTDSIRTEVSNQEPTSFLLQHLDSITPAGPGSSAAPCDRIILLIDYVRGTAPGKRCYAVPRPGSLSAKDCRVRQVRVVGARGSQLYIPYYSWLIQTTGGCYSAISGEWNTFGSGIVGQLAAGDTVVVQEREVALHR